MKKQRHVAGRNLERMKSEGYKVIGPSKEYSGMTLMEKEVADPKPEKKAQPKKEEKSSK